MWNHDRSWNVVSITIVIAIYYDVSRCEKYKWERQILDISGRLPEYCKFVGIVEDIESLDSRHFRQICQSCKFAGIVEDIESLDSRHFWHIIFAGIVEDIKALPELPKISGFWLILEIEQLSLRWHWGRICAAADNTGLMVGHFPFKYSDYFCADPTSLDHCSTTHFPGPRGKQLPQSDNRNAYAWWTWGRALHGW